MDKRHFPAPRSFVRPLCVGDPNLQSEPSERGGHLARSSGRAAVRWKAGGAAAATEVSVAFDGGRGRCGQSKCARREEIVFSLPGCCERRGRSETAEPPAARGVGSPRKVSKSTAKNNSFVMDMCKSDNQSQERQMTVDGPESARQPRVEPVAARMSGDSEDILADQPSRKRHEGCTAAESSRGIPHRTKEVQVQSAPYRLRVVPIIWRKPLKDSWSVILLRVAFSQVGLALMLLSWTMCFAVAFHFSEGPNEQLVIENFQKTENDLAIDLSTQLRQIGSEFDRSSSFPVLIHRQLRRHTTELLAAFERGYGGTGGGRIWNYAGCVLFAVSLLTTLGFGAPVPHTNCGRTAAAIFATIGVPLHFLLMFNIAQALLSKLHLISSGENIPEGPGDYNRKTGSVSKPLDKSGTNVITVTSGIEELSEHQKKRNSCFGCNWGGVLVMAFAYYILGILIFGVARGKYYQDALLFPLEFINNGALAQVGESMRLLYALYLEGLILHAALFFAVIRRSAGGSLETMFFRNNLLTNT